jgi:hyperosmotically inducible periplasmic protein
MSRISSWVLAAAVLSTAVGCAMGPRKSEAERQADKETADRVQAALSADQELYSRHINVHASSGVIRLSGYVWSQPDLLEAQRIAESVQGVTRVVDDLELERGGIDNSPVSR